MTAKDEERMSSPELLSQGTWNYITKALEIVTPPELPVTRTNCENINNSDIILNIPEATQSLRNIKERYKVNVHNNKKIIYLPKDARFRVDLNYTKFTSSDLFVRIYPSASDFLYRHRSISCCPLHGQRVITKVNADMLESACKSIFEVYDCDAKYESIELLRHEVQISVLLKFWNPDIVMELVLKCYNTCHDEFKKSYPQLNFAIERRIEPNKYEVLSENTIYFKVCASPARDCKSMALKKRLVKGEPVPVLHPSESESPFLLFNGKKYFPRMISEDMNKIIDSIEDYCHYGNPSLEAKLKSVERFLGQSLLKMISVNQDDLDQSREKNRRES